MVNDSVCTASKARRALLLASVGLLTLLAACVQQTDSAQGGKMNDSKNNVAYFDVVLFSYLDRPIFDVYLNGKDIGVAGPFGGGGGLMTGVAVPLGPQVISWRLDGVDKEGKPLKDNGGTVKAKNQPVLTHPDPKKSYLGVHIYPDNTVEVIPEPYWPEKTPKGLDINRQWELKHGK